ncbi:MAG: 2-amino-4-hydroxy-6-hydroxymethyldihydropteridine diphosphokinase [Asticcacaulis sp.]|uniref:2-amino-4-hydroxy-6- hydroxymethyldihydropteridine diphosphokinase n=1 Tax=Asticcacaulis sp. TaxID=1872648 RepID=UPI0039E41E7A
MAGKDKNMSVFIAYGSNLLSAPVTASQAFASVVKALQERGPVVNRISRLWVSKAWPNPDDPPYVNAVLQIKTDIQPAELMLLLHEMEHESGRVRDGRLNAPRVLDLDLIAYDDVVLDGENGLILPHPRAAERAFVMGPMSDIAPDWLHPILRQTAANLFKSATIGVDAYPL